MAEKRIPEVSWRKGLALVGGALIIGLIAGRIIDALLP